MLSMSTRSVSTTRLARRKFLRRIVAKNSGAG
jgi:hypothetical protein